MIKENELTRKTKEKKQQSKQLKLQKPGPSQVTCHIGVCRTVCFSQSSQNITSASPLHLTITTASLHSTSDSQKLITISVRCMKGDCCHTGQLFIYHFISSGKNCIYWSNSNAVSYSFLQAVVKLNETTRLKSFVHKN